MVTRSPLPTFPTFPTFADLQANLSNVAVPGTGIPLSFFARNRLLAAVFLLFVVPVLCLVGAVRESKSLWCGAAYTQLLLAPRHWFGLWQLNSRLTALHSAHVAARGDTATLAQYDLEDKWQFTQAARGHALPVGRVLEMPALVLRNKNVEGGMGVKMFRNALHGGDWIINERLDNADSIAALLPADAPLSTLRVMTSSRHWVAAGCSGKAHAGAGVAAAGDKSSTGTASVSVSESDDVSSSAGSTATDADADAATASRMACVQAMSCVFRAGRSGALTDHKSVLFDVDLRTGVIGKATSNSHWYQLGATKAARCPWRSDGHTMTHHPDTGKLITGAVIPDVEDIVRLVRQAHAALMPDVPVVGWDVALTTVGLVLLEANLSANFFKGTFDEPSYVHFCSELCEALERNGVSGAVAPVQALRAVPSTAKRTVRQRRHGRPADVVKV